MNQSIWTRGGVDDYPARRHPLTGDEKDRMDAAELDRQDDWLDDIRNDTGKLTDLIAADYELADLLRQFVYWSLAFRHKDAPVEFMRIAGMVDREIRKSAEEQS